MLAILYPNPTYTSMHIVTALKAVTLPSLTEANKDNYDLHLLLIIFYNHVTYHLLT